MKPALCFLLVLLCISTAFSDDQLKTGTVQMRLREIELDVLLKEYATLRSEVEKLETLLRVEVDPNWNDDPKTKSKREKIEQRIIVLRGRCEQLRERAEKLETVEK